MIDVRVISIMSRAHDDTKAGNDGKVFKAIFITNQKMAIILGVKIDTIIKSTRRLLKLGLISNSKKNGSGKNYWDLDVEKLELLVEETLRENKAKVDEENTANNQRRNKYLAKKAMTLDKRPCQKKDIYPVHGGQVSSVDTGQVSMTDTGQVSTESELDHNVIKNIYIYLCEKSSGKADEKLLAKFIEEHGRSYEQIEVMIDRINTYNLDVVIYKDALKKLSYLTYFDKLAPEFIEVKLNAYIDKLKNNPVKVVRSVDPRHDKPIEYWMNRYQEVDSTPVPYQTPTTGHADAEAKQKSREIMRQAMMASGIKPLLKSSPSH